MTFDFGGVPITPLESLFDCGTGPNRAANHRPELQAAHVILGVDVMSGNHFLVYGRAALEEISRPGKGKYLRVARISVDQDTDELEKLIALVRLLKGHDDYQATGG